MSQSIKDRTSTILRMAGNIAPAVIGLYDRGADQRDPLPDVGPVARYAVLLARAIVEEVDRTEFSAAKRRED